MAEIVREIAYLEKALAGRADPAVSVEWRCASDRN